MWRGHFQDIFKNVSNVTYKQFVEDRINCISDHHITTPGDIAEALNDLKSNDMCNELICTLVKTVNLINTTWSRQNDALVLTNT